MDPKFCSICATTLRKVEDNLFVCSQNHHIYVDPKPTNAVIIQNDRDEILLVTRKYDPKAGWLDLPGGFVNLNENLEESLKREVREELGIELQNWRYFTSNIEDYEYKGVVSQVINFTFVARQNLTTWQVGDDISDARFYPKDQIPFEKMAFPGLKQVLQKFIHHNDI